MVIFLASTAVIIIISFITDYKKTLMGFKKAGMMFANIFLSLITVLILVSFFLALMPQEIIFKYLGKDAGFFGHIIAAIVGSIALIPGFVAYPLGALLIKNGISYSIIAVFITTLMMVGILTLPIEARFFGWKSALLRNGLSFMAAIIIGTMMGLLWGIL